MYSKRTKILQNVAKGKKVLVF